MCGDRMETQHKNTKSSAREITSLCVTMCAQGSILKPGPSLYQLQSFNDRLRILEILSMEERFRIACITFVLKCLKGEVHAEIATRIIGLHGIPTRVTRNPNLFNLINLPIGSPLRGILLTLTYTEFCSGLRIRL